MLRALIKTADELITLGYDPTQEVEQVIDIAEKRFSGNAKRIKRDIHL